MHRFFLSLIIVAYPLEAVHALPPPDLIITALQSVLQVFGAVVAMVIVFALAAWDWIKNVYQLYKKWIWGLGGIFLLFIPISLYGVLYYQSTIWKQDVATNYATLADEATAHLAREKVITELDQMAASDSDVDTELMNLSFTGALDYETFKTKLKQPDMQIVDVRTYLGVEKGSIPGSLHYELPDLLFNDWKKLDPTKPVMIICYAGSSGVVASDFLSAVGFSEIYFPKQGIYKYRDRLSALGFEGEYFDPYSGVRQTKLKRSDLSASDIVIDLRTESEVKQDPVFPRALNPKPNIMTTEKTQAFLEGLDPEKSYALVCSSPISCYYTAIQTAQLKARGLNLKGTIFTNGTWNAWTIEA